MNVAPLLFAILVFLVVYNLSVYSRNTYATLKPPRRSFRMLRHIHFACLTVCATASLSYLLLDIGLRGLWTSRIFFFTALLTGLLYPLAAGGEKTGKAARWYFRGVLFLPNLAVLLSPLLFNQFIWLVTPATFIHYDDSNYRVQQNFTGIFKHTETEIFAKKLLLEQRLKASYEVETHIAEPGNVRAIILIPEKNGKIKKILLPDKPRAY